VAWNSDPATEIDEMVRGAFPDEVSVTVRVAVCPTATDPNATLVLLSVIDAVYAFNWIAKLLEPPFAVAAMLAVWVVLTLATVAVKVAADAPDGTVIDDGTETAALLLLNETVNPPLGAAEFKVTVHVSDPAPVIACFAQTRD